MPRISIKFFLISVFCLGVLVFFIYFFLLPPKIISTNPINGSGEVSTASSIIIEFDKPVKRQELEHFIFPEAHGEWIFENPLIENHLFRTLVFIPAVDFQPNSRYEVRINNIKGFGLSLTSSYSFGFETGLAPQDKETAPPILEEHDDPVPIIEDTEDLADSLPDSDISEFQPREETNEPSKVTLLDIRLDWQDKALSCEAASLKMALAWKGINVSEDEIMEKIGYDLTSRQGDVWGDPYKTYVGDIDGKICQTGFGVYWGPVAKAANYWTESRAFSSWDLEDLTTEIQGGNPVLVWGTLPVDNLNDCSWYTSEGKFIRAFKETHVRLAIGFVGEADSPLKIILNDPLSGRLYWDVSYFLTNWQVYARSGVVVRE